MPTDAWGTHVPLWQAIKEHFFGLGSIDWEPKRTKPVTRSKPYPRKKRQPKGIPFPVWERHAH